MDYCIRARQITEIIMYTPRKCLNKSFRDLVSLTVDVSPRTTELHIKSFVKTIIDFLQKKLRDHSNSI